MAGYNPWIHKHPVTDFPEPNVKEMLLRMKIVHEQDFVDNVTQGLWAADARIPVPDDQVEDWPVEQRAAYFARRGMVELGQKDHARVLDLIGRDTRLLWIRRTGLDWYSLAVEKAAFSPVDGASVTLTDLEPGRYRLEYWSPEEGKLLKSADVVATKAVLEVPLPDVRMEAALKVRALGGKAPVA